MSEIKNICDNPRNLRINENLFEWIGFPMQAHLHKRVAKKMFLESGELVASDKKLFRENVKNVYWEYTLKPSTCTVLPYRDNEREYLEVAVLQVEMNSPQKNKKSGHKRIAEIIHRLIPYPLMIGFYLSADDADEHRLENLKKEICENLRMNQFALSIAPKRFSQAEHGAFVAERFYTTGWILTIENGESRIENEVDAQFIDSLAWDNLPLSNYGVLYQAWIDCFVGYECAELSGEFKLGKSVDRMERLTRCREVESHISQLRWQLKKAAFNRQVELNTQIKKFEQELKQLAGKL